MQRMAELADPGILLRRGAEKCQGSKEAGGSPKEWRAADHAGGVFVETGFAACGRAA